MTDPEPQPVDLNVPSGPDSSRRKVEALRAAQRDEDRRNEAVARPRIEQHLKTYKLVPQHLEDLHGAHPRHDLDPTGYSRPAAVWLMAGRCLGLLRALLIQVEAGVCGEAVGTARMLHEATGLLMVRARTLSCV